MRISFRFVGLLLFGAVLVTSATLTVVYKSVQAEIRAESNKLYSEHAIQIEGDFNEVVRTLEGSGIAFLAYLDLDSDERARALYISPGAPLRIPVHDRIHNAPTSTVQAWVGAGVSTEQIDGVENVNVAGKSYIVGGHLGRQAKSLLSDSIVIIDCDLFQDYRGTMILDSPGIGQAYSAHFDGPVKSMESGIGRRTNLDLVTPIVLLLGVATVGIGGLVYGIVAAHSLGSRNRLLRIIGRTRAGIRCRIFAETFLPLMLFSSIAVWGISLLPRHGIDYGLFLVLFAALLVMAAVGLAFTPTGTRSRRTI